MLSKIKISHKIYLQGLVQLILMILMGSMAIYHLSKLGHALFEIAEEDIPLTKMVNTITIHQFEQAIAVERVFFKATLMQTGLNASAESAMRENMKKVSDIKSKVDDEFTEAIDFIDDAITKLHSENAIKEYQKLRIMLERGRAEVSTLNTQLEQVLQMAESNRILDMVQIAKEVEANQDQVDKTMLQILQEIQNFTQESALKAEHDELFAIKLIIGQFVFAIALTLALPFLIGRAIVTPINALLERISQVAEGDGDLTLRLDESAKDETGSVARAFNHFLSILNKVISGVATKSDELGKSSEISLRAMEKAQENVEVQRIETEQVAAAIEEMSLSTKEIARNTSDASEITNSVKEKVAHGRKTAQDTQSIIQQLSVEVEQASEVISQLVNETNNIGMVLETIQSIADQTNLLALNAAIEAARAGESGRGFAVVADEVRSLAQRTRESTIDIQGLVERLQSEAQNAVESMGRGTDSTTKCLEKGILTSKSFEDAANSVNEISDLNQQIATASEEQALVAMEINKTLVKITRIAEETSVDTQNTTIANKDMAKSLIELHTNINVFKTDKL